MSRVPVQIPDITLKVADHVGDFEIVGDFVFSFRPMALHGVFKDGRKHSLANYITNIRSTKWYDQDSKRRFDHSNDMCDFVLALIEMGTGPTYRDLAAKVTSALGGKE